MRKHAVPATMLLIAGLAVSISLVGMLKPPSGAVPATMGDVYGHALRLIGIRFFGYGALVLLGAALAIGPLARLQPLRFSRLLAYRRAVGIWSALATGAHLIIVLLSANRVFFLTSSWTDLFVRVYRGYDPDGRLTLRFGLSTTPLGIVSWTGLIAFLLLLVVALVSNNFSQRRLGHAAWKLIQQWSYTAFLFAALHIGIMTTAGGKFKTSPPLMRWSIWFVLGVALLQAVGFIWTIMRRRPSTE